MQFPRITIRDLVETQHELLTGVLGIHHLKAVMGISMGGMQTFQRIVAYPSFMDKAIPIVGSPRLAPHDLVLWQVQIDTITNDAAWNGGKSHQESGGRRRDRIWRPVSHPAGALQSDHYTRKSSAGTRHCCNRQPRLRR